MSTTQTFGTLPTEILANVFDRILLEDLRECEKVCKSWYPSAHRLLLKIFLTQIGLTTATVEPFMKYNPSALNHLKRLKLGRYFLVDRFDHRCTSQLFENLKNLEQLDIVDSTTLHYIVEHGIHKVIAKSCPYLKRVVIPVFPDRNYHRLLHDLRRSSTHLCIRNIDGLNNLSSFPCLEEIDVRHIGLEDWMPLFSQEFTLKSITGCIRNEPENDFSMDKYMESKPQEVQDLIINKLSKLEILHLSNVQFYASLVHFITHYITGLKHISYTICMLDWSNAQRELFWGELLDYTCNIQTYNVQASVMIKASFSSCLPSVLNKGLQQIPSDLQCVHRTSQILEINMEHEYDIEYRIDIESTKLNSHQITRSVKLEMPPDEAIIQLVTTALTNNSIDTLEVDYNYVSFSTPDYIFMIRKLLDKLRMVKRVTIAVPRFGKHKPKKLKKQYPQVTHLQLAMGRVYGDKAAYDVILHMFPKIKYLKLYHINCTQVEVPYQLEVLYLDVTMLVRIEMDEEKYTKMLFVVDLLSKGEQHFYTIPVGKLTTKSISKEEAQSMEEDKSTLTFRLRIPHVHLVILYLCRKWRFEQGYMDDCPEELVEAKLSFR